MNGRELKWMVIQLDLIWKIINVQKHSQIGLKDEGLKRKVNSIELEKLILVTTVNTSA